MHLILDQTQLQRLTVTNSITLMPGQVSKGCFVQDGVLTKRTPITRPSIALALATL